MLRRSATALLFPLAGAVLLAGCTQLQQMLGKPEAHVANVTLRGLDLKGVDLAFDVVIGNPYSVAMPLLGLDYDIAHGGKSVAKGTSPGTATSIPAHGSGSVPMTAHVDFAPLLALAGDIKPGAVVDYVASLGLSVQAPGVGPLRLPVEHAGSFPVPTAPEVTLNSLHWDKLALTDAAAVLDIGIRNTNAFAVELSRLQYELKLGGMPVASSSVDKALSLAGGAPGSLKLKLSFKPADLGLAAFQMLTGSEASYELGGRMTLGSAFGSLDLPYSRQGKVPLSK